MADLVTVEELRSFVRLPELPDEAAAAAIAGVSGLVREYTGRAFEATTETVTLDGTGSRVLLLPRLPVRGVSELVEAPGDDDYELTLVDGTHFEWSSDGRVRRLDGGVFRNRLRFYRFTYEHGEAVPDSVKLVILRVCARSVVNPEGLSQENASGYGSTFGFDATRLAVLADPDKDALAAFRVTV